ncbi:hypothetical protein PENSTE_c003G07941 [Penicillium steckii]|uniref:Uncharacterized protein n=1 Tax=Penicillium steckii TaxID=303698 RepID=A0A1V6TQY8_9EURO|nr:hypothetical protein PENSTE_c003G07941 [Penicillium steckii]
MAPYFTQLFNYVVPKYQHRSIENDEEPNPQMAALLKPPFDQYWNTCTELLKNQLKDYSHVPSSHEEVARMMKQLHTKVAQVWQNTEHEEFKIDRSHVNIVLAGILECTEFINDNPTRCREAVNSMIVILRFMREIYPRKTLNQSLRRQIKELERYESPNASHYINRIIPQYLPSKMPASLTSLDARIYAIRWRGFISLLELRATTLRDHPRWSKHVEIEIQKLLVEVKEIKFNALTDAMKIGAFCEELVCIADHCTLAILIVKTQLRALNRDNEKAEWVALVLIEYLNSLDLHSGSNKIEPWSDDEDVT